MFYVKDLIDDNPGQVIPTVASDTPIYLAFKKMVSLNANSILVTSAQKVSGILTANNLNQKLKARSKATEKMRVQDVMSSETFYVSPQTSLEDCLSIMKEQNIFDIPVIENDIILGMISQKQVIEALLNDRIYLIDQLIKYITGSYSNLQNPIATRKIPLRMMDLQKNDTLINVTESPYLKVV